MAHRTSRFLVRLSALRLVAAFAAIVFVSQPAAAQDFITVASTTSTDQSGLFKALLPAFKTATGIEARVVAVGHRAARTRFSA